MTERTTAPETYVDGEHRDARARLLELAGDDLVDVLLVLEVTA